MGVVKIQLCVAEITESELAEAGRDPPRVFHLVKERHNFIDGHIKGAVDILAALNEIAALFGVLVEGNQPARFVLVNQLGPVATPQALDAGPVTYSGTVPMFLSQPVISSEAERMPGSDMA